MSHIDDLIRQHCPNGVEYRAIGEIAQLVRGSGMPKSDFVEVGSGCIHYGQIYTYYGTWATSTISFVTPEKAVKLVKVDPGDLIVTSTSENVDDVCKAVAWLGDSQIVTGGHATVLKHEQDSKYLAYYLQTAQFHAEKRRHASGTKVIDVSAKKLAKIRIPVPPLVVQQEIARVLDLFEELEAELEAELATRRRQYAHYRDSLLTFPDERGGVRWMTLGEIGSLFGGLTGKAKADFQAGNARYVSYMNVFGNIATDVEPEDMVRIEEGERQRRLQLGDVLFTGSSETPAEVGMSSVLTAEPPDPLYLNSFCIGFRGNDSDLLDSEFTKHLFRSATMRHQIVRTANGVTRFNVSKGRLAKVKVPIPSRDRQSWLARVLDNFEALVNDLSVGLPAELAARRKQYEYYRDHLLTFEEAA
ncbi:restriction endonuclease subunit S [soil metagenome]